ncbi:two-component regulator propeller domain-containing protein [Chitinophaga sp. Cy-1792]|uniref:ligand-binding sensor domain-containing protein n=1 Tax=Chitinophaga sp. Cy-1792 TaxID=2608339 RepID=UPI00141E387F|nr:two-component regulator propeller domain-containing protein [Chitinophaga sp. Cy-1792]NIG54503.1 hypothetical protein [Chitinophaga sp. Cy-1792]
MMNKIKYLLLITLAACSLHVRAQNIFPVKLDNCSASHFCLDCGNPKAGYDEAAFAALLDKLNEELNLTGMHGDVMFQVLVSAKGRGCVLSHTDISDNPVTAKIIAALNKFKKWTPAISKGKIEEKTSINLLFTINDNKITGQIQRVNMADFRKSFDRPADPEIYNKTYQYKNENLKNYTITSWTSGNSTLPNNMIDHITIDKPGLIWLTVDDGLVTFDGKEFKNAEQNITPKGKAFSYYALATDNQNVKWVYGTRNIYSYDNTKWTRYDAAEIGIDGAYNIINNPTTGEVFFCSDEGITIYKDGKWSNINKSQFKDLSSNRVTFARRDSKNRLWIGTFSGTAMIDENNKMTNFEKTATVLKGKCITSMDEDENGNLYFTLFEYDKGEKGKINADEGIAIRNADGSFKQFTTDNSGMPFNHTTCVLYDKKEKVLWISTDRAGLIRYDLKDNWENYHNKNSTIPTSYISTMVFDNNGVLYLATRQGLVKVERK